MFLKAEAPSPQEGAAVGRWEGDGKQLQCDTAVILLLTLTCLITLSYFSNNLFHKHHSEIFGQALVLEQQFSYIYLFIFFDLIVSSALDSEELLL